MTEAEAAEAGTNIVPIKKGRGRPAGSKNKERAPSIPPSGQPPAAENPNAVSGGNAPPVAPAKVRPKIAKEPMTDEQEHAMLAHHVDSYEKALKAKKAADSELLRVTKLAKAEGVSAKSIKEYISYQTDEGQQKLREDIERKHKIARWAGVPVGTQLSFFEETDREPIDDKVRADGKRAGLKGEAGGPPRHYPGNLAVIWEEGYREGQEIQLAKFQQKPDDESEVDDLEIDDSLPVDELSGEVG